jgi:hypothetical protein
MAKTIPTSAILSHWYKLIDGLPTSPLEFYRSVERVLERRGVPQTKRSRIDWKEGGAFSAKREYLRVARGRHGFDVCAAPYGNGSFFVSWWLGEPRPSPVVPTLLLIALYGALALVLVPKLGLVSGTVGALVLIVGAWFFVGIVLPEGRWEAYLVVIPGFGWLFEKHFRPSTYYKIDTALMFQSSVHAAVLEVIDELTTAHGLHPLSELERKPILRGFYK